MDRVAGAGCGHERVALARNLPKPLDQIEGCEMTLIAVTSLFIGTCLGFVLARRFMLRTLVGLILGLIALILFAVLGASDTLPGEGYALAVAAFLIAPPMASGLFGGAVIAWLFRSRPQKS